MKITSLVLGAALAASVASSAVGAPLLRYTFDEASGNALDSGTAPLTDATFEGGAVRSTDTPSGAGFSLDLRNDAPYAHLLGQDAADLDGLSAITITTWLKVQSYPSGNHRLASKQNAGTFGGFNFSMNATPNSGPVGADNFRVGMFIGNNVSSGAGDFGAAFSTDDVDAADKWVMLAVTYDNSLATDNTRFYLGGVNSPMVQLGAPQTLPQITIDGGPARFGVGFTDAAPTANTSVIGWQDDVRVYGAALQAAELERIRIEGIPEPSAAVLLGLGAALLASRRRR
ncbi:MAG TPA: PEP-CTERM sorting domain-containing protein [Lacipirellulaceae bacterium]|nr:PEP-CTERM sorting domain-containing protein [Lacipirellulaceae bacterium]